MFGMAGETEFDLRFSAFGIPVRIHPIFWASSAWIVWDGNNPGNIFLGILCLLISVLVHELGHALMCRRFGFSSEIVLYFLGGYATGTRFSTWKNVKVSIAGPAAGFALFIVSYLAFRYFQLNQPDVLRSEHAVFVCLRWLLFMNLMWSVLNLVPCLPLDGGQIAQVLIHRYAPRQATERVAQLSILASGFVAVWSIYCMQNPEVNLIPIPQFLLPGLNVSALQPEPRMLAILFGILCASQVIAYNERR